MDKNKQIIAIAEYIGLKVAQSIGDNPDCLFTKEMERDRRQRWRNACSVRTIPDYTTDLNAMHEAEEHLSTEEIKTYMGHLLDIMGISVWCITHVSAEQRAEAFVKTIGKWEE